MKVNDDTLPKNIASTKTKVQVNKPHLFNISKMVMPLNKSTKPIDLERVKKTEKSCKTYTSVQGSKSTKYNDAHQQKKPDPLSINLPRLITPHYNMQPWGPSRAGKKLLVLDLDQTVCDFGLSPTPKPRVEERRPYLTKFLNSVYEFYDIVIWSATKKSSVLNKIHRLRLFGENSKILFYLDIDVMFKVKLLTNRKRKDAIVKPLESVWRKAPRYSSKNTLMIDDIATNFIVNPKNGLQIKPYSRDNYKKDNELVFLTKYLINLAKNCNDFTTVNHKKWRLYKPNKN